MIKCPNCGSTAQVREVGYESDEFDNSEYWFFECGCGTDFRIDRDGWDDYFLNHNGCKTPIHNPFEGD